MFKPYVKNSWIFALVAIAAGSAGRPSAPPAAASETLDLRPLDTPFPITGRIVENLDVSAIARNPAGIGLIGSDEKKTIQSLRFLPDNAGARVLERIPLPTPGDDEADVEGIAWAEDGHFYVVGSHSVSRKKGETQDSRTGVYRLKIDPDSGKPATGIQRASLLPIIENDAVLAPYVGLPLQNKGFNVEGLAARGPNLYFGIRSPNVDGNSFILEVDAEQLFSAPKPRYTLHRVPLGPGFGIRSLESVQDGFLILAGNAGSEPNKDFPRSVDYSKNLGFVAFLWDPASPKRATPVGRLLNPAGKAEALMVLAESDAAIDFIVLFDGAHNGGAIRYRATRQPHE